MGNLSTFRTQNAWFVMIAKVQGKLYDIALARQ